MPQVKCSRLSSVGPLNSEKWRMETYSQFGKREKENSESPRSVFRALEFKQMCTSLRRPLLTHHFLGLSLISSCEKGVRSLSRRQVSPPAGEFFFLPSMRFLKKKFTFFLGSIVSELWLSDKEIQVSFQNTFIFVRPVILCVNAGMCTVKIHVWSHRTT